MHCLLKTTHNLLAVKKFTARRTRNAAQLQARGLMQRQRRDRNVDARPYWIDASRLRTTPPDFLRRICTAPAMRKKIPRIAYWNRRSPCDFASQAQDSKHHPQGV
ncbi:hypothetical protein NDU88_004111 [Pleurodeles waltl]|uniref:Uncharacterized protein n=1 Tax=Pleurodeles waltl TaxID=8319 RepID=A0AAV7SHU6_PLEWA|nr:hypothetical protein NDU88_004111 [Pleurodeles waltl]